MRDMRGFIVYLLISWLAFLPTFGVWHPGEARGEVTRDTFENIQGIEYHPEVDFSVQAKEKRDAVRMSLEDFIKKVVERNENILIQELDFRITKESVKGERSVFEPEFSTGYQRGREKVKYSQNEQTSLLFSSEMDQLTENYNAYVSGKVPSGASLRLGYTLEADRDFAMDEQYQYKSFMGLELSQPLLKGGGMASTATIDIAEADSDVAFQTYRQKMLQVVLNAAATCWDFYQARENLKIRRDSVKIAQTILNDNKERVKLGKMAKTEVLETEAGLAKRKSQESMARQDLISATNTLLSYISSAAIDLEIDIQFDSDEVINDLKPDLNESIKKAFLYRPEYLSAMRKSERENILVSYAKNQRWPQLDLTGSYGVNGLADSPGDSWDDMFDGDYRKWTVGAVLTLPLLGGMKSQSELASARYRKKQALLELKSVEVDIVNTVDTAIRNVYSTLEQLHNYRNVKDLNQRLLEVELAMLDKGKSNTRSVLEKEEDLIEAKEAELESFINNRKAILVLETAEGSLLKRYGVDVLEKRDERNGKEKE